MVNVVKERKGNTLIVRLTGSIDENVNFDQLIGPPPPEIEVNCKDVPRINSMGVKLWIRYFQSAKTKGTKIKLVECSTAIVDMINMISNFVSGDVVSIYVPFTCTQCKSELLGLFKTRDIKKLELHLPDLKCSKCGGKAVFDDVPELYLGFVNR